MLWVYVCMWWRNLNICIYTCWLDLDAWVPLTRPRDRDVTQWAGLTSGGERQVKQKIRTYGWVLFNKRLCYPAVSIGELSAKFCSNLTNLTKKYWPYYDLKETLINCHCQFMIPFWPGLSNLGSKTDRLAPNGTNLGILKRDEPKGTILKTIFKSLRFVPFGTNLTDFGPLFDNKLNTLTEYWPNLARLMTSVYCWVQSCRSYSSLARLV